MPCMTLKKKKPLYICMYVSASSEYNNGLGTLVHPIMFLISYMTVIVLPDFACHRHTKIPTHAS